MILKSGTTTTTVRCMSNAYRYWIGVVLTAIWTGIALMALPCQSFVPVVLHRSVLQQVRHGNKHMIPVLPAITSTSRHFMVASSTSSSSSSSVPVPKYPVQRGEELDSRKIVTSSRQHLTAIRLNHILFASEEMAIQTLHELRLAALAFDELAFQVSNCAITREERGHVGWVSVVLEEDATNNHHLDLVLPPDARKKVVLMNTKVSTEGVVVVECGELHHPKVFSYPTGCRPPSPS